MKEKSNHQPPKWANWFLELYCNPALLEQIQGDLYELYFWRLEEDGERKASRSFWWDVIRFFRWRNIKRSTTQHQFNNTTMLKNYFKLGWRNLLKQKLPSFINISGLALAIACCMIAYLFIESVWLRGMHHENKENIYELTHKREKNNDIVHYGNLASPMAKVIEVEFPEVDDITRVNTSQLIVKYKNDNFSVNTYHVDPAYMNIFTHNIIMGDQAAIEDPYQLLITESTAALFFNNTHPIGEQLLINLNGELVEFTVGAVIEDHTSVAMFHFEVLINNYHLKHSNLNENWNHHSWTFIHMKDQSKLYDFNSKTDQLITLQNDNQPDAKYTAIEAIPFMDLTRRADEIQGGAGNGAGLAPQIVLSCIGLFLLLLAVFNYINIAILMATKRIKEIGVRKVIGSKKSQLVMQFLSENLITCFLALSLGVLIAHAFFIPWFNNMATTNLAIDLFNDPYLYLFLIGLLLFITLASGAYPAFYISALRPVQIFSNKQRLGGKGKFTNVLLTFQFVLSVITIVAAIAFLRTGQINESRDWGYDNSSKIVFKTANPKIHEEMTAKLSQHAHVTAIAGTIDLIGHHKEDYQISIGTETFNSDIINGGLSYPETMDLRLSWGRFFDKNLSSDIEQSVMVNQSFLDQMNISDPSKTQITISDTDYNIVGVVEDFHYANFRHAIEPTIIRAFPDSISRYMVVKVNPQELSNTEEFIKDSWHNMVDNDIYEGYIQSEVFDFYFEEMRGLRNTFLFTASFAIILSAMGLFGLVSLNISAKLKDYSIRKILGASLMNISKSVLRKYLIMWLFASVIGGFLASMAISALLESVYSFHNGVGAVPIVSALSILLIVIITTIFTQIMKVEKTNPSDTLRVE